MPFISPIMKVSTPDLHHANDIISSHLDTLSPTLRTKINRAIHDKPETAFKEFFAHDTIANFLESQGFDVKRSTYGLETSLETTIGEGGRQVVFCAEYDALPEIGHACGHNLIATASIAAFLAASKALKELNIPGRLRLLGTPAEEGFGGKAILIDAGAFEPQQDIAAAIMAHPMSAKLVPGNSNGYSGLAGFKTSASHKFKVEFHGKTAHAAGEPWNGVNAMDAAVSAYYNAALMRQQIRPDERIHHIIEVGGTVQNVIPDYTRMSWNVRGPNMQRADALLKRVKTCIEAGAASSGCKHNYTHSPTSMNLRANETLCTAYANDMKTYFGREIIVMQDGPSGGSTDMGNVSHHVPSFHGTFVIPTEPDVAIHNPAFAAAAGTDEAHVEAIACAKGMAMLALRVLVDNSIADGAKRDFDTPDEE